MTNIVKPHSKKQFYEKNIKKRPLKFSSRFNCGAGGSRTLVQTRNNHAFYMLILPLVFVKSKGTDTLSPTLSSKFSRHERRNHVTIPKLLSTSLPDRNREHPSARCLVPPPCERIKLHLLYFD